MDKILFLAIVAIFVLIAIALFYKVILLTIGVLALSSTLVFVFDSTWRNVWLEAWRKAYTEEGLVALFQAFLFDLFTGGALYWIDILDAEKRNDDKWPQEGRRLSAAQSDPLSL